MYYIYQVLKRMLKTLLPDKLINISMKPKRIILIRHGESQANVDKYLFGRVPDYTIELTEKGHEQARGAGKRLKELVKEESVYFYVSPFWRARSTFEEVASAFPRAQFDYSEEPRGEIGAFPPSLGRRNPPIQS